MISGDRYWTIVTTAWGYVGVIGTTGQLIYASFPAPIEAGTVHDLQTEIGDPGAFAADAFPELRDRLQSYFLGKPADWSDLPVQLYGTDFQIRVWEATRSIKYGQTVTYAEIAALAHHTPRAARAAGAALASNRAGLLVPCHRVVSSGGIGGYGSRPERKRALLDLEARVVTAKIRS